jgi:hypothetical protein
MPISCIVASTLKWCQKRQVQKLEMTATAILKPKNRPEISKKIEISAWSFVSKCLSKASTQN